MIIVERLHRGFQWAEPPQKGGNLEVEQVGSDLHISGLFPRYRAEDAPSDLIRQFEKAPKNCPIGQQRTGKESPDIRFANADSDEKLIAFVRRFGPVVAKCVRYIPDKESGEPQSPAMLMAHQRVQELRNEHLIYRAALRLIILLKEHDFDYELARNLIREISAHTGDWPRQWERERSQRQSEPTWKLSTESLRRIEQLASGGGGWPFLPTADARIVICELLNSFRGMVFPNRLEMHGSIKYGIRPLLYSILRRQFLAPRDFASCANTQCRDFFNLERAGQQFCSPECSQQQRQRTYWKKRGKKLRKERSNGQRNTKR
jgi:hypothetical protein